jgi:hypothetical protein
MQRGAKHPVGMPTIFNVQRTYKQLHDVCCCVRVEKEVPMEVKDYCRSVEVELIGWKAKMYDMVRKVDRLRGTDAQNIQTNIEELHKNISDMERIIGQLRTECPLEYGPQKKDIATASSNLESKYEDAMAAVLQF